MMIHTGELIIFEGLDLSGKTSAAHSLVDWLNETKRPARYVRAPGQTQVGKYLRQMVISQEITVPVECQARYMTACDLPDHHTVATPIKDQLTIELLHLADLRETITTVIKPALDAGVHVICDRFHNSTRAYAAAHRVSRLWIEPQIDLVIPTWLRFEAHNIHFEIPIETFLERRQRLGTKDPLDTYSQEFYERVLRTYQRLANNQYHTATTESWTTVDATAPMDQVLEEMKQHVTRIIQ